jgi:hypothetical protein
MGDKNIHSNRIRGEIFRQMYDVRPVRSDGSLDLEKIRNLEKHSRIKPERKNISRDANRSTRSGVVNSKIIHEVKKSQVIDQEVMRFRKYMQEERERERKKTFRNLEVVNHEIENVGKVAVQYSVDHPAKNQSDNEKRISSATYRLDGKMTIQKKSARKRPKRKKILRTISNISSQLLGIINSGKIYTRSSYVSEKKTPSVWRLAMSFSVASLAVFVIIFSISFASLGLKIKNEALLKGEDAYANLENAKEGISRRDFAKSSESFEEAYLKLDEISNDVDNLGGILVEATKYLPYVSKLSSGSHLAKAGKDLSRVGFLSSQTMATLDNIKNPLKSGSEENSISYLEIFKNIDGNLKESAELIRDAKDNLNDVNLDDIPEDKRTNFSLLKQKLPQIESYLSEFLSEDKIFADILGGNGPRKYLFLFQNNQEMRPTGGFIGTYALLDIFNGRVNNFKIDGIFNPDGQLRERVVPPEPIQKISAAWSLHDSNWFPSFPTSAEKAAWFFEKTGGPTVDGVITMTPVVMQKLLEVTGPIEMPEYGVTVDRDNFLEKIQYEVEVDYDKDLNQPKKILGDLAPKILDRIFNAKNISDVARTMSVLAENLNEKHILLYSKNWEIEKVISQKGWSGEIMDTRKDYLSVINTNINGFKTDGMIDEDINHTAEIQPDGSIVDTVIIRRHHNGGDAAFEWWNKVNADYMRVYVPKGSKLISVDGQTREFDQPPLDYDALGYKRDAQVKMEEDSMTIDEDSGTRIYEDSGKTVFANWTYVSPKETVEIKYVYLLPFKIETNSRTRPVDAYSILYQKQSGSVGSHISSRIIYPENYQPIWKYPDGNVSSIDDLDKGKNGMITEDSLKVDKFVGIAFKKE